MVAPWAADQLLSGGMFLGVPQDVRVQAATILNNFAQGRMADGVEGFGNVPLISRFGTGVLPDSV